jgi:hypothetical protein
MNVLERCQLLRTEIDKYETLTRVDDDARVFRQRAQEIGSVRENIRIWIAKRAVLAARNSGVAPLPSLSKHIALVRDYRESVASSPQDAGKVYVQLKRTLTKLATDTSEAVAAAIATVKAEMPSVEEPFLKAVERIPGYEEKVARIRAERALVTLNAAPQDLGPDQLAQFLDARGRLQSLADELRPAEFPREVLEFFQALRRGGLPVDRLTDVVRGWLDAHGLLNRLRITLV